MKSLLKRGLRKIFYLLIFGYYIVKCEIFYLVSKGIGLCFVIEHSPSPINMKLLKHYGAIIGENCQIDTGITIHRIVKKEEMSKLSIGREVYIGHRVIIDLTEPVYIGDYSAFGADCQIWTHTGSWTIDRTDEKDKRGAVIVHTGVIVYSGSIIGLGVTLGPYSRVGAGSVVLRNVEPNTMVGGVPAKIVKEKK